MKINANEKVLLMNKKIGTMGADTAPVPETTVSNPTGSMKALEAMGKQNIAFQGGLTNVAEKGVKEISNSNVVKKGAHNLGRKAMILAAVLGLGIATTSCEKDTFIDIDVPTTIDMSAFTAAMNAANEQLAALTVLVANMQTQQAVQVELLRQQLDKMDDQYALMLKMYNELLAQGKTQEEIKENLDEYCKNAITQMETIVKLLGTDSPIYQKMTEFLEKYKEGKLSAQEAYEKMIELLKSLDSKMDTLISQNDDIKDRMDVIINNQVEQQNLTKEQQEAFMEAYNKILAAIKDGTITNENFYQNVYKQWTQENDQRAVIIELLTQLGYTQDEALKYLEGLDTKAAKSEESAKAAFEELMEKLNSIDNKLATLIKQNDNIKEQMDEIIDLLIENNYITAEQKEVFMNAYNEILAEIKAGNINNENFYQNSYKQWTQENTQREIIIEVLVQQGYTQAEALEYLKKLDTRAEKDETSAKAAFEELMEKLSSIDSKLDTLIKQNDAIKERMDEIIDLLIENNYITAEQKEVFMNAYNKILAEIKAGNINDENFYQNSYKQWAQENEQREVIISILTEMGYTQSEALEYLKKLDTRAEKSEESAKAAFEELMEKLSSIEAKIEKLIEYAETFLNGFDEYAQDVKSIKALMKQINSGVSDINNNIVKINSGLNESLDKLEQELQNIKTAINNASFENVAAITEGKDEIIAVMEKLGYEEQEVIKMSKDEIVAAIEKNTERVKDNGAVLSQILAYMSVLPELRDAQEITNAKIDIITKKLDNLSIDVEISPETLAELEVLFDRYFEDIAKKLDEINDNITTQGEGAITELKKTNVSISGMADDVKEIKNNSAILITYDQYILDAIKNVGSGVTNIEEIAAQIGVDVSWIREHGGGSGSTVDLSKIESLLEQEIANTQATNYVVNLMYAEWSEDLNTIKDLLSKIKNSDDAVLEVLNSIDNKNALIIAAINAFADQQKISDQTRNDWLEKIYNKKCDCAKDVTIIVEKIYKYLVDGNEGIVDYDKLFDDLFGDEESTKAMASATKTSTTKTFNYTMPAKKTFSVAQFYETAANLYAQTPQAKKGFRAFQREANQQYSKTFNA